MSLLALSYAVSDALSSEVLFDSSSFNGPQAHGINGIQIAAHRAAPVIVPKKCVGLNGVELRSFMVCGENTRTMLFTTLAAAPLLALLDKGSSMIPLFEQQTSSPINAKSVQSSIDHFSNPWFLISLLMGLAVAALCGLAIAWHPRRSGKGDPVEDLEQRNTLILLAMVGAIVSELVRVEPTMALVIFGIGGLIRFRTVLDNPKVTGKAIMVVVIGLASGLGELAMAVFFTVFAWLLIFWLDSNVGFRIRLKLTSRSDSKATMVALLDTIRRVGGRTSSAEEYEHKDQIVVVGKLPSSVDPVKFKAALVQKLPQGEDVDIDLKTG